VIREALITCDNPARAKLLRSYWDQTRTLSAIPGRPYGSPPSIRISFSSNDPGKAPVTVDVMVGIAKDDLDLRMQSRLQGSVSQPGAVSKQSAGSDSCQQKTGWGDR